jgi:nucleotide-binding universal stress UspA family protein
MTGYETIVLATDGSDCARAAGEHALELAATYGATLHALYVVDATDLGLTTPSEVDVGEIRDSLRSEGQRAVDAVTETAADAGIDGVGEVRVGVPHEEILAYAGDVDADLLVLGTHGRTGLRRYLLGSVAERVVRLAEPPILTVHAEA